MANLTYFLEFIARNQDVWEEFDENVLELFSMRGKISRKNRPVVLRLIEGIIQTDRRKKLQSSDPKKPDIGDFRVIIISYMQQLLLYELNSLALQVLDNEVTNKIVKQDIARAWTWAALFASKVGNDTEEPRRRSSFPID
jgi:hypothetical protein